jgi:hypothetical protein
MRRPDSEQEIGASLESTWLGASSASTGYKWEIARFSARVAVKVGWEVGWGGSRPRHSQGSVYKTTTKSIYKQEFCPAHSAIAP